MLYEHLSINEIIGLLNEEPNDIRLEELARKAHDLTIQRFGKTIELYAPIYLSNSCINSCRYCGFSKRDINKNTLTPNEVEEEARFLLSQGHRHILLVAGEDPNIVNLSYLQDVIKRVRKLAAKLSIEIQPFDEESYKCLVAAGIDGVTLYQETYHKDTYEKMHPSGPKSNFESRLKAIENAGKAGVRFLGIGALLGLYNWRSEAIALINHARSLQKRFWQSHISISFPRIRDCASDFRMPSPVSDRELTQMIIVMRLALPDTGLVLSTREDSRLRDHLLHLGITNMSAGSVTSPGGYTKQKRSGEQFHIEDKRSPASVANVIKESGYQPVWKDWEKA